MSSSRFSLSPRRPSAHLFRIFLDRYLGLAILLLLATLLANVGLANRLARPDFAAVLAPYQYVLVALAVNTLLFGAVLLWKERPWWRLLFWLAAPPIIVLQYLLLPELQTLVRATLDALGLSHRLRDYLPLVLLLWAAPLVAVTLLPHTDHILSALRLAAPKALPFLLSPLARFRRQSLATRYLLIWVGVPLLVLAAGLAVFTSQQSAQTQQAAAASLSNALLSSLPGVSLTVWMLLGMILVAWTALLFTLWIMRGDANSELYSAYFQGRRAVTISFLFITVLIVGISMFNYSGVADRARALHAEREQLQAQTAALGASVAASIEAANSVNYYAYYYAQEKSPTHRDAMEAWTAQLGLHVQSVLQRAARGAALAERVQQTAPQQWAVDAVRLQSYGTVAYFMTQVTKDAAELETAYDSLNTELATANAGSMEGFQAQVGEVTRLLEQITSSTAGATSALSTSSLPVRDSVIIITVLYAAFLLFPWILLFQFLIQKQDALVGAKAQMLQALQLAPVALERSPDPRVRAQATVFKSAGHVTDAEHQEACDTLIQTIRAQAFGSSEYAVSLGVLTIFTATLWYHFFYPGAAMGLAQLIAAGGDIEAFSSYLIERARPITFGFLGAYLYIAQMLMRRFFAADLNPQAYVNAFVRLVTVFIVSVMLELLVGTSTNPTTIRGVELNTLLTGLAFTAGIFPFVVLHWMLRHFTAHVRGLSTPELLGRDSLTLLEGINSWHEGRLLEEKIEGIQNLATASLDDLIIHTNFSPQQLVDWVDQALLYLHTTEQWRPAFRAVGIRTASDLLGAVDGEDPDSYAQLAEAINAAQGLPATAPPSSTTSSQLALAGAVQPVDAPQAEPPEAESAQRPLPQAAPVPVTPAVIKALVHAIQRGPNTAYVQRFWNFWPAPADQDVWEHAPQNGQSSGGIHLAARH